MIGYFDTSAFVPLLIAEPTSALCRRLWDDADAVVTTRLTYAEAAAVLAQALRLARLTEQGYRAATRILDRLWDELDVVDVDDGIVRRAAQLAYACALRGDDAVHCASAEQLSDSDLVVATGDRKLVDACRSLGIATADVTDPVSADDRWSAAVNSTSATFQPPGMSVASSSRLDGGGLGAREQYCGY